MEFAAAMERAYRRILMMVARCRVTTSNDAGAVRTVQARFSADEIHDLMPQIQEYGFASRPLPECDAVVVHVSGDRTQGIVIGTNDQRYRPKDLEPGDVMIYDWQGNSILLSAAGVKVITAATFRVEAKDIELHATDNFKFDVNGHGQHWHPSRLDTWQIGESGNTTHTIAPPEIP